MQLQIKFIGKNTVILFDTYYHILYLLQEVKCAASKCYHVYESTKYLQFIGRSDGPLYRSRFVFDETKQLYKVPLKIKVMGFLADILQILLIFLINSSKKLT